jgi:hypothetical protein
MLTLDIGGYTMPAILTNKLINVYIPLPEDIIEALKAKSGEYTIKDALAKAVYHYLDCPYTTPQPKKPSKKSFKGRKPLHLVTLLTKTTVHPSEKLDK